jgi:hypothetical protein
MKSEQLLTQGEVLAGSERTSSPTEEVLKQHNHARNLTR